MRKILSLLLTLILALLSQVDYSVPAVNASNTSQFFAAPTLVQEKLSILDVDARFHSISFDSAPTEGNLVIIGYHVRGTINAAVVCVSTPSSGVTVEAVAIQSGVAEINSFIVTAAQENTYTSDADCPSGGTGNIAGSLLWILEISGYDTGGFIDVTSSAIKGSESNTITMNDLVTTFSDDLLIAALGVRAGADDASVTCDGGFTCNDARDDESTSGSQPSGGGYGIQTVTSTGTYATTFNWTDNGKSTAIGIAIKGISSARKRMLFVQ